MKLLPLFLAALIAFPCDTVIAAEHKTPVVMKIILRAEIDDAVADDFDKAFGVAKELKADKILVVIDSPGGVIDSGWRMIRTMKDSTIPVACVVDGMAASMAGVLLEACPVRMATHESLILFHGPSFGGGFGRIGIKELKSILSYAEAISDSIAAFCSARMGMDFKEFKAKIDGTDWWLATPEAVSRHAIDWAVDDIADAQHMLENS